MGPLIRSGAGLASWLSAALSLVAGCTALLGAALAADGNRGAATLGMIAAVLLAIALVSGWSGPLVASSGAQVVVLAWAAATADDPSVGVAGVLAALCIWVSWEAACTSFDLRPGVVPAAESVRSRIADGVGVLAVGGVTCAVAVVVADAGPTAGPVVLRIAGVVVVVAMVAAVLLLSRRVRLR